MQEQLIMVLLGVAIFTWCVLLVAVTMYRDLRERRAAVRNLDHALAYVLNDLGERRRRGIR